MSNKLLRHSFGKRCSRMEPGVDQERPGELSDQELICLASEGDSDAFDMLYLRYKPKLAKFIRRFIQDDSTADDLLQETFLRVYSNTEKYQPKSSFSSWIYRIATNMCLNEIRRRRTHPMISLNKEVQVAFTDSESETIELHELIPDTSFTGPGEAAESSETIQQINSALGSLSSIHREVVTYRIYDELKYEQIAEILQCSVGTVKSRTFYGLRALRDKLDSEGKPE